MASFRPRGSSDDQELYLTAFINFNYEILWPVYDQEGHLTSDNQEVHLIAFIDFSHERLWLVYGQEVHLTIKRVM